MPAACGQFLERDRVAEEFDGAAGRRKRFGHIADVERDQIHGNAAHDRHTHAADRACPPIADGAHETVCISQCNRCEHSGPPAPERGSVANALPLVNSPALQDPPLQDRGDGKGIGPRGLRISAIEPDAGAHHVEGIVRAQQDAASGGETCRRGRQHRQRIAEARELHRVHGVGGIVGAGQMAH